MSKKFQIRNSTIERWLDSSLEIPYEDICDKWLDKKMISIERIHDMAKEIRINDSEYAQILQQAVSEIQTARATVARQVNTTVNSVYWNIGKLLFDRNLESGYGSGVVKRLSVDLKEQFPDMGLSPRNLWNMKRLYERYYQEDTKLLQAVAVLPWGHNLLLLDKALSANEALFYAEECY